MSLLEAISPTAREVLAHVKKPMMPAEIDLVAHRIIVLYEQQRGYLANKPDAVLEDLRHRCEEATLHGDFSVRTAAEINFAACEMLLAARGHASKRKGGKR
jgi:hypothetical protein